MENKISNFDVSEYLTDNETIAAYLTAILEEGDSKLLLAAIGDIAKARGMAKIASDSGLGRESLYKALNPDAKPRFDTVLKVLKSLGVNIGFNSISKSNKSQEIKSPVRTRKKPTTRNVYSSGVRKVKAKSIQPNKKV
jgi:probable addiction module antidote protein